MVATGPLQHWPHRTHLWSDITFFSSCCLETISKQACKTNDLSMALIYIYGP